MKNINPDRIIVALSLIGLASMLGCSIFEPRLDVVPHEQLMRDIPPASRATMNELNSPALTATMRRAQGDLDEVKK